MPKACPVTVVRQRGNWDCGIAALAMVLQKQYADVSYPVRELIPVMPRRGLGLRHLKALAASFGVHLHCHYKSKDYLRQFKGVGILSINGGAMCWAGHWVVIKNDVVIDPDDERIYSLTEYLQQHKATTGALLQVIN